MNTTNQLALNTQASPAASAAAFFDRIFGALLRLSGTSAEAQAAADERAAVRAAEAVREMADRYAETDPSFAADLYAAAQRYEETV